MLLNNKAKFGFSSNDTEGVIAEKVDLLFEKRKAVRESALKALHATLSLRYCGDALESRHETLVEGLERVLKDQQLEPTLFALRTAAVTSISLPLGHHALLTKLKDQLTKIIADDYASLTLRLEAIQTLSVACFMSATFDVEHEVSLSVSILHWLLSYVFAKPDVPPEVSRAALQGAMLLASSLPKSFQHQEVFEKYFADISELMDEDKDTGLRISAAKAITAIIEWEKDHLNAERVSDINEDLGTLLEKILAILDDKAKFKNKPELKKQRSTLKALIMFLEGGAVEEEQIVIRSYGLSLHTWTQIFRMERFRACLMEGFMTHLEENKNLMFIFDYYLDVKQPFVPTMTKQQRRMSLSESSKVNTKARGTLRAIREQEVGYATE